MALGREVQMNMTFCFSAVGPAGTLRLRLGFHAGPAAGLITTGFRSTGNPQDYACGQGRVRAEPAGEGAGIGRVG
jgi:hypothetical protein